MRSWPHQTCMRGFGCCSFGFLVPCTLQAPRQHVCPDPCSRLHSQSRALEGQRLQFRCRKSLLLTASVAAGRRQDPGPLAAGVCVQSGRAAGRRQAAGSLLQRRQRACLGARVRRPLPSHWRAPAQCHGQRCRMACRRPPHRRDLHRRQHLCLGEPFFPCPMRL